MRVALYGAGQVSGNVAQVLSRRGGTEVLGPFNRSQREEALRSGADVVVIATTSFLAEVAPDIRAAVEAGSNVITTAEEAAYPWAVDAPLADELDRLARERGVTILGGGLNPGFAFDALVVTAAGAAWDVESIRVARVVDLSGFGETVLRRIGIGYTEEEFEAGTREGQITGHIGFPQSMRVVAGRLGVELERIERRISPLVAAREFTSRDLPVPPGHTAGFEQHYQGIVAGRPWFEALFTGHLDPTALAKEPRDEIWIEGSTPVHIVADPGFNPQIGSSALVANSLRRVVEAAPGWVTVADLPPATPSA